jgi:hypothetical protein
LVEDITVSTSGGFVVSDSADGTYEETIVLPQNFSGVVYMKFSSSSVGEYYSSVTVSSGELIYQFCVCAVVIDESFSVFVDELNRKYVDENGNGYVINFEEPSPFTPD